MTFSRILFFAAAASLGVSVFAAEPQKPRLRVRRFVPQTTVQKQTAEQENKSAQQQTNPVQAPYAKPAQSSVSPQAAASAKTAPASTTPASGTEQPAAKEKAASEPAQVLRKVKKQPDSKRARPIRYLTVNNVRYYHLADIRTYLGMNIYYLPTSVVLQGDNKTQIVFSYNKREGFINGNRVFFLYPLFVKGAALYVSELDFLKVISPVIKNNVLTKHKIKTIMLDPGHGGSDPGAKGPLQWEKTINLQIALRLKKQLEKMGFRILMTRSGDVFPTLQQRVAMNEKWKPDLYLSIHCNAATTSMISGVETFATTPSGAASSSDNKPLTIRKKGNTFDKNNYRLAYEIQRSMALFTGMQNRGVRHARFFVIINAPCPAVLIECGYLSNRQEGTSLSSTATQDKLVSAIIFGLANYASAIR